MEFKLSAGELERLAVAAAQTHQQSGTRLGPVEGLEPVVQVLRAKKAATNLLLAQISDGVNTVTLFFKPSDETPVQTLIDEDNAPFAPLTILKLKNYSMAVVKSGTLGITVSDFDRLGLASEQIGNPVNVGKYEALIGETKSEDKMALDAPKSDTMAKPTPQAATVGPQFSIEMLSPFQNFWTIEARVTSKSDINEYSNQNGAGTWFAMTLMDKTGEIRCMAFNDSCEKFFHLIEEGKVYMISKARIAPAKNSRQRQPAAANKSEYQMTLEPGSIVELSMKQDAVPQVQYNFVSIAKLNDVPPGAMCDVLCVVQDVGESRELNTRFGVTKKRDIHIIDDTSVAVQLTLWGKAEQWPINTGYIYAFKGLKVSDFQGRSLSTNSATTFATDLDIPEVHRLEAWYQNHAAESFSSISVRQPQSVLSDASSGQRGNDQLVYIEDILKRGVDVGVDKPEYFVVKGFISSVMRSNMYYPACPNCAKKVNEESEDSWRCERCQKDYPTPVYRYTVPFSLMDLTGQITVNGFNDFGEKLLGITAAEFEAKRSIDSNPINVDDVLNKVIARRYSFTIRAKQDTYGDSTRVRFVVQNFSPFDAARDLPSLIDRYAAL